MILSSMKSGQGMVQAVSAKSASGGDWQVEREEGQLAVDVVDTGRDIVVMSTMAGAATNHIEVYIHSDLLTIRGRRESPLHGSAYTAIHEECYWGKFSRTIVLPTEVKGDLARAEYRNGVLTIRIPKRTTTAEVPIRIVEE